MSGTLTERQKDILDFLQNYIEDEGYPPTLREIGLRFGIKSTNGVNDHLQAIERKGYIRRSPDTSRGIVILGSKNVEAEDNIVPFNSVPILGAIAAGVPLLAVENIEGYLKVDDTIINSEESFALRVKGESMIEDHIADGDFVIIRRQNSAAPNEIIAAMIEDEVTLKRFFHFGDYIELRPSNSSMSPIRVEKGDASIKILGKMVGLIRRV
jgi:repressor LexA